MQPTINQSVTNMGLFCYTCPKCGGGEKYCGVEEHNTPEEIAENGRCEGGNTCFEEDVIFEHEGKWMEGIYSGYGYASLNASVKTPKTKVFRFVPEEHRWLVVNGSMNTGNSTVIFVPHFYCRSCFEVYKVYEEPEFKHVQLAFKLSPVASNNPKVFIGSTKVNLPPTASTSASPPHPVPAMDAVEKNKPTETKTPPEPVPASKPKPVHKEIQAIIDMYRSKYQTDDRENVIVVIK
jgi:hypothetical protein